MLFNRCYESCKFSKSVHPIFNYGFAMYYTIKIWNFLSKVLNVRQRFTTDDMTVANSQGVYPICVYGLIHCKLCSVLHNSNTQFQRSDSAFKTRLW